jgi:hypothetical protein
MKRLLIIIGCLLSLPFLGVTPKESAVNAQSVSVGDRAGHAGFFYQSLRPYGEWIELESGFHAWQPTRVRAGWRPYLDGRWTWTDYGWYWVSYEPFGWAVFHYGRWYLDDYYGWIWVPDDVWGAAWVEWRYDNDYIGWAPLPPYASFSISVGIRFTTRWYAHAGYWNFVRYRHFGSTRINAYVLDEGYSRRLIRTTRGAVRYEVDRDRIVNRGVDRELIERRGNLRINRTEVGETRDRGERIVRDGSRERIEVYRPSRTEMDGQEERIEARKTDRRTTLDMNRIERNRSTETIQRRESEDRSTQRQGTERTTPDTRSNDATGRQREQQTQQDRTTPRREVTPPTQRRVIPDRNNEFRMVQPQRPRNEQTPQQRESTGPAPKRENTPPARAPQSNTRKRGKDN